METKNQQKRPRGRPKKNVEGHSQTRQRLLRAGIEALTEVGYSSVGLETILKREGIPKGSFYYYFDSKASFGQALIENYNQFFKHKLNHHLKLNRQIPLFGFHSFVVDAINGIEKYHYQRGCLIGNLGQELNALPLSFQDQLVDVFKQWTDLLAHYLEKEQNYGHIRQSLNCCHQAQLFWIGWEGAVLHAKLQKSSQPIKSFADYFTSTLN